MRNYNMLCRGVQCSARLHTVMLRGVTIAVDTDEGLDAMQIWTYIC